MKNKKKCKCYVCGEENNLTKVKDCYIRTSGYPVFLITGYICNDCKCKIIKR
jgi:hypothetical protein